ncbi:SPOR domain-containing protein [Thalassospira mesophila]|uniref:SPOR domain-containing protein n=1 Tax=Thalassospira mesophila TaxID=1293891 RepID=UPI000A200AC1|nr:SPOR domain-containing protein [Thalassospira mesophila]
MSLPRPETRLSAASPRSNRGWQTLCLATVLSALFQVTIPGPRAAAQNVDLNSQNDTVSGLAAIPTDLPASARRSSQYIPPSGPLDLLELARAKNRNGTNPNQNGTAVTAPNTTPDEADFLLSSRYRSEKLQKPRFQTGIPQNRNMPARPAGIIQASIMRSDGATPANATQWARPQSGAPAQPAARATPTLSKPVKAAPPPNAQMVTPWSQPQTPALAPAPVATPALAPAPAAPPAPPAPATEIFAIPLAAPKATPTTNKMAPPSAAGEMQTPQPQPMPLPAPQTTAPTHPAPVMPVVANGDFALQLGAFRTAISAETYWASFAIRYHALVQNRHHYLEQVDLPEKGRFHRLRIGGFATLTEAKEKCRQLMADGTACIGIPK